MFALPSETSLRERGASRKHWALGFDGHQDCAPVTPSGVCVCVCVCVGGAGACEQRVHGNSVLCVCVWVYVCQCWKVCVVEMGVEGGGGIA